MLVSRLALVARATAVWEFGSRWWETYRSEKGYEYWRNCYDAETLMQADGIRQSHTLRSTGTILHIDVYPRPETDAPVLVLAEHAHPLRCQPIRPLFDIGIAVATGDSSLLQSTPCRHTIQLADTLADKQLWSTVVHPSRLAPLIKRFQGFSTTEKRDRSE